MRIVRSFLGYSQQKVMQTCFENSRKHRILGPFWILFWIQVFMENPALSIFSVSRFAKFQRETNEQIPRKTDYTQIGGRKNKHDSTGLPLTGFKNVLL